MFHRNEKEFERNYKPLVRGRYKSVFVQMLNTLTYKESRTDSNRFDKEVMNIIKKELSFTTGKEDIKVTVANDEQDMKHASDFIVTYQDAEFGVASRIRSNGDFYNSSHGTPYSEQFTIRNSRRSNETEFEKILNGAGDYFFYGFKNEDDTSIGTYTIGRLDIFRDTLYDRMDIVARSPVIWNSDGSSSFRVFNYSDFPTGLIVVRRVFSSMCQ